MTDSNLISEYHDVHEVCKAGWEDFLFQAQLDLDYYHRAQHTEKEVETADQQERILHTMDKISRQVNLIHGYEIRNRHILKIGPLGQPDIKEDHACEQHTGVVMSLMALNGGYNTLSNAFKWGNLIQGSNLLEIWRDRLNNLRFSRLGFNQYLLDPGLTQGDLSDCNDILTGQWITSDKAKMLVPTRTDEIDKIKPLLTGDRWTYLGNPYLGNKQGKRLFEQWWRRKTDFVPTVVSRITGQEIALKRFAHENGMDQRAARKMINEVKMPNGSPAASIYDKPVYTIKLTVFLDNEFLWDGDNPLGLDDFNFVWLKGDWCPESPRSELKLQSFVRGLRDPQRAFNRRINQIYDIIETHIQDLRIIRPKWILNLDEAYKSGQGVVVMTNEDFPDEADLGQVLRQEGAPDIPPGLFQALEATEKAETETMGLNTEIFGSDEKDIPGILHSYRTGQALTGQAGLFEGFRESKRRLGQLLVQLTQLNYSPRKIFRLINELPSQGFYQKDLIRYDCNPMEGLLTESQQQLFYMELKALRLQFPEEAALIPLSEVVKFSPTPFKNRLIQIIQRGEQAQRQKMQEAEQIARRQAMMQEALAKSELAQATERNAQAQENLTSAALDRVNTMAKIQELQDKPLRERMKMAINLEKIKNAHSD